jgi:Lrp/AsnC family leucine-responsive transcriptional regulator
MKLDATDLKILQNLQEDSKQTSKALALKSGLSVTAVYERVKRLEKNGVIRKNVALLDPEKLELGLKVFCHVKLDQHIREQVTQFEKEVAPLKEVVSCYHIGGEYDYLLEIYVRDMPAYREFMVRKLTAIKHIGSTQSAFVIREVKHTTEIPLSS